MAILQVHFGEIAQNSHAEFVHVLFEKQIGCIEIKRRAIEVAGLFVEVDAIHVGSTRVAHPRRVRGIRLPFLQLDAGRCRGRRSRFCGAFRAFGSERGCAHRRVAGDTRAHAGGCGCARHGGQHVAQLDTLVLAIRGTALAKLSTHRRADFHFLFGGTILRKLAIPPRCFFGEHAHHVIQMRFAIRHALLIRTGEQALIFRAQFARRHDFIADVILDPVEHDQRSLARHQCERATQPANFGAIEFVCAFQVGDARARPPCGGERAMRFVAANR